MVTRFRAGPGCLEDPTFKEEMAFALQMDEEDAEPPGFMPSSDVLNLTSYGFRITQPYALLSESEYTALLDSTPAAIKLKPTPLPFLGPGQSSNFYMMDMHGLPPETIASCKKLEMYYTSQSQHNEWYLTQAKQLHQSQGARVFQHIAQAAFQSCPEKVKPTAAPKAKSRPFGIVVPQVPKAGAKAAARKAKAKAAATGPAGAVSSNPNVTPSVEPGSSAGETAAAVAADDDRSESTAGLNSSKSKQAILIRLDDDMRRVAERHMSNHAAGSVKSLETLDPLRFLPSPNKALSIALTSVHYSVCVSHIATICLLSCSGNV